MNRDQKAAVIDEIAANIEGSDAIFAVDYRGITVGQAAELRVTLREADARFSVVKNTLSERAADQAGAEALKEHLQGPTALTFVRGDAAAAARTLREFGRRTDLLAFKGGFMNGAGLTADQVQSISRLPSREVLYGQLVGIVAHPISGLARTLSSLIGGLAIALGQVSEQGLVPTAGGAGAAPAAGAGADDEVSPADVPTEGGDEPVDADAAGAPSGDEMAQAGAAEPVPAEGGVVAEEDPDQDAGPASTPEADQPDQAEGE